MNKTVWVCSSLKAKNSSQAYGSHQWPTNEMVPTDFSLRANRILPSKDQPRNCLPVSNLDRSAPCFFDLQARQIPRLSRSKRQGEQPFARIRPPSRRRRRVVCRKVRRGSKGSNKEKRNRKNNFYYAPTRRRARKPKEGSTFDLILSFSRSPMRVIALPGVLPEESTTVYGWLQVAGIFQKTQARTRKTSEINYFSVYFLE